MELDRMLKALGEPMRLKIYQSLLEKMQLNSEKYLSI